MKNSSIKTRRNKVIYTVLAVVTLCTILVMMTRYVYLEAEDNGFEMLHVATSEIKEDLNLQMVSDRENLYTIANMAAKLYSDGENFQLLFDSFEPIGLIHNIGILQSDNTFLTKNGKVEVSKSELDFEQESQREAYVSGRVRDLTHPEHRIVRSAVPVTVNGETVAVLYGMIELDVINKKYEEYAVAREADLYVLERGNGNIIIDTLHEELDNISTFKMSDYKKGFSYELLMADLHSGNSGYSAFMSGTAGESFYAHYAPLKIGDWQIMLSKPERIVFKEARELMNVLITMFMAAIGIMVLYLLLIFTGESKQSRLNYRASHIRKILLGINQTKNGLHMALENITMFSKARSSFFVDTDGEDFHYISPKYESFLLKDEIRTSFVLELLCYAARRRSKNEAMVILNVPVNSKLRKKAPKFYNILKNNHIKRVCFTAVSEKRNLVSVLGVINPRSSNIVCELLADIAVCCSMAVYNKKYLNNTEVIAMTDALTGVYNRLQFKKDVEEFDVTNPEKFACIYIDVNELHSFNSKYGHGAGDTMLLYIAKSLKETFPYGQIYRMGGDEFLVFSSGINSDKIHNDAEKFINKIESMNYHVSVGIDFCEKNTSTETVVKTAEDHMYEAKAEYYQQKERAVEKTGHHSELVITTGVPYLDTALSVVGKHYYAIVAVSLNTGIGKHILMPEYLRKYFENQTDFTDTMRKYIDEFVSSDDRRACENFLRYDAIKHHLELGNIPAISYTNTAGEKISLTVHAVSDVSKNSDETLWVFEKVR